MSETPADDLLPLDAAMAELKIKKTTLYRYVNEGEVDLIKHGGKSYISKQSITDYWIRRRDEAAKRSARRARSHRARRSLKKAG